MYLPGKSNVIEIKTFIKKEIDSSNNIKSKETRKNVQDSLRGLDRFFKNVKILPENGLIIYTGHTRQEGFVFEQFESPTKINCQIYKCHHKFETETLLQEINNSVRIVIYILINGNECRLYESSGNNDKLLWKKSVDLDGDTSRGGQSQARNSRNRDIQKKNYLTICSDHIKSLLVPKMNKITSIFVGGSSHFKVDFIKMNFTLSRLNKNSIVADDLQTMKDRCKIYLEDDTFNDERMKLNKLYKLFETDPQSLRFGKEDVLDALTEGLVKELYISRDNNETYEKMCFLHFRQNGRVSKFHKSF